MSEPTPEPLVDEPVPGDIAGPSRPPGDPETAPTPPPPPVGTAKPGVEAMHPATPPENVLA